MRASFVMLSPWTASTKRRSIEARNLASRDFWLSTRCPVTSQIQRPDFGRLSKTATPRATSPSFWRFASPERSRSRTGRHHQRRARHPVSHVRDRTRFFEGLGTTRPACRYGRHPTLRNDSPNWELFDARGFRVDALEDGEQFH